MTESSSDIPEKDPSFSNPTDKRRKVVKRPSNLKQLYGSELRGEQLETMKHLKALMGGSIAEQIRKAMGGSLAEQMRQAEQSLRPLNHAQDIIGRLTRDAMESPVRRFLAQQDSLHRQMTALLRPKWNHTLVGNAFADSLRTIQSFGATYHADFLASQNAFRQELNSFNRLTEILRSTPPWAREVSDSLLKYPARVRENLVALAIAGWYLDPEMAVSDIVHFKEDLENDTAEEVNNDMVLYFQSSLERIEETLCSDHPARAHLIREAFAAHRNGKYSLSIPALFAQADGICYDLTGCQIFTKNGISRFAKRIAPEAIERAYLEPLLRDIPIAESSQQRRAKVSQLNRHAVMHGESTNFSTEENGLKAVSFVNFVSHVLGMVVSKQNAMPLRSVKKSNSQAP